MPAVSTNIYIINIYILISLCPYRLYNGQIGIYNLPISVVNANLFLNNETEFPDCT